MGLPYFDWQGVDESQRHLHKTITVPCLDGGGSPCLNSLVEEKSSLVLNVGQRYCKYESHIYH